MKTYRPPINKILDIIYRDDYIIIINKPSGLLSVPGKGEVKQDCLISRVQNEFPTALIVHRLDMSTSGILLLALDKKIHRQLSELFAMRKIQKKYTAVVEGVLATEKGQINQALISDWPNRPRQIIDSVNGKPSITNYNVKAICKISNTSRLELIPETGRTHQLRVHMKYIGHAILGDDLYASEEVVKKSQRLLLHATSLKFQHPVNKTNMVFDSVAPF